MRAALATLALATALALAGCGDAGVGPVDELTLADAATPCAASDAATRPDGRVVGGAYATGVVSFTPGEGATFGQGGMPDIVLGPPQGAGDQRGGTDVVSLGRGGEIVLSFERDIIDQPGDDFVVFENAFTVPGVDERYWEELGEVAVSDDGVRWVTFRCDPLGPRPHLGCAGWTPVYSSPANGLCAIDPRVGGGDRFDLASVGLARARFVRIRDLQTQGLMPPATGFDLDAVGVIHAR